MTHRATRHRTTPRSSGPLRAVTAGLLLALTGGVAGCTGDPGTPVEPAGSSPSSAVPSPAADASDQADPADGPAAGPVEGPVRAGADPRYALVQQLLDERAEAVRDGDLAAFTAGLAGRGAVDQGFRAQQKQWFRNLQQLPVGVLSYEVGTQQWDPSTLPERRRTTSGVFFPVVTTAMRLRGFDDGPVSRIAGVTVVPGPDGYRVAAVDDVVDAGGPGLGEAPWDLVALDVRRQASAGRTLLLLDDQSAGQADTLLSLLAEGTARVQSTVPFDWQGDVVAYATGAERVIAAIDDVPGGDVAQVGALTFPVYERPGRPQVASFRFALNPEVLSSDPLFLRRLVTHELTHVALGKRDDGAPTWLSEGVAEYVGAQGLSPTTTRIALSVVERARDLRRRLDAGEQVELSLPPSRTFNGPEADWHYGLSWYAVEWIVANRGPDTLWRLVRTAARGSGTRDDDQDAVLREVVGLDADQLARRAVDLVLATYGG